MLDFSERKDLLVLLIIGILVVVAIMLFSLIMIWSPKDEEDKFYVGKVSIVKNISDEYKLETYLSEISKYLVDKNYDELYKYISKDYTEYSGLDVSKLKQKCEELKIAGDELVLGSFESNNLDGYNKIYIINALTEDEALSVRLVLREISPRNFTISFDEFVLQKNSLETKNAENVIFELVKTRYTSTNVIYDVKITNKNLESIVINSANRKSAFILNYGKEFLDVTNQLNNEAIEILPGQTINTTLNYKIENITWSSINSITLRDVKLSNNRTANLEFEI